jgi:hypothetical protein
MFEAHRDGWRRVEAQLCNGAQDPGDCAVAASRHHPQVCAEVCCLHQHWQLCQALVELLDMTCCAEAANH